MISVYDVNDNSILNSLHSKACRVIAILYLFIEIFFYTHFQVDFSFLSQF